MEVLYQLQGLEISMIMHWMVIHTLGIHYHIRTIQTVQLSNQAGRTDITKWKIMMICRTLLGWLVLSFRLTLKVKALLTASKGLGVHKSVLITNVTVNFCIR